MTPQAAAAPSEGAVSVAEPACTPPSLTQASAPQPFAAALATLQGVASPVPVGPAQPESGPAAPGVAAAMLQALTTTHSSAPMSGAFTPATATPATATPAAPATAAPAPPPEAPAPHFGATPQAASDRSATLAAASSRRARMPIDGGGAIDLSARLVGTPVTLTARSSESPKPPAATSKKTPLPPDPRGALSVVALILGTTRLSETASAIHPSSEPDGSAGVSATAPATGATGATATTSALSPIPTAVLSSGMGAGDWTSNAKGAAREPQGGGAAALAAANAMSVTTPAAAPPAERTIPVAVPDHRWPQALAAQVVILAGQKLDSATLHVVPAHLGPIQVRIDIRDSQVNVNFGAAHLATRTALEQAMPQLRATLADGGLTLGEATVQQQMRHGSQLAKSPGREPSVADDATVTLDVPLPRARGFIDEYV